MKNVENTGFAWTESFFDAKIWKNKFDKCRPALMRASKGLMKDYNFIEGMICSGGCIGGAGCLTHGEANKKGVENTETILPQRRLKALLSGRRKRVCKKTKESVPNKL